MAALVDCRIRRHIAVTLLLASLSGGSLAAARNPTIGELKRLNVEDLMNIEVMSVARHPERLLDAAAAIQVITAEGIRRSGAVTLPEALRLADNLQTAQRGARGWAISARGFNTDLANKLLVMIDGRTVYTPLFSGVFWEAQDYLLEDVERIEVVSGPGGTLWGANAVNGVINVITRKAADTQGLHVEAGGGTELTGAAGVRYGGELSPQMQFRLFAKHVDHDDSRLADGSPALDAWHRSQLGFRIDSAPAAADVLTLQGDYYENRERVPGGGVTTMRGANLLGRWTRGMTGDSGLTLQVYYDWTYLSDAVPALTLGALPVAPSGQLLDDLRTLDVDFQHRFRAADAHAITWGLGFRHTHDVVRNAPALAFFPAVLNQELFSAFVQDEIRLREGLSLTIGSKIEHNDYTGVEVEPSARLQWQPAEAHTLWAAMSRAVRAPSRIDRDLSQAAPPYLVVLKGGPDFTSEKVTAYELGYRTQPGPGFGLSLSAFYNVYSDVRSTTITLPTLLPFYFVNDVAGDTWGLEFSSTFQVTDRWSLRAGYNLLQEDLHVKPGRVDISNGRNETADPQHQVALRSSLDLSRGLELDAGLRWVDTLRNNNGPTPGSVPAYFELDARLAWHVTDALELSITGRNLLHDRHPEYGFPAPGRTEVERSVYGKLTWRQ
jgi:iron complex outermembrane receptor protein